MDTEQPAQQGATPLVTIITPTYNRERYLAETIESVLAQDYPNIEYIVLDDGSTDATPEILARYADRLTALRHENHGQAWTVNRGFEHAQGEFICLVNSDDPLPQIAIRELVDVLLQHPDVLLVYPDWEQIDQHGEMLQRIFLPPYSYLNMLRWFFCMPGPGTVFRRSLVNAIGGWNPAYPHCPDFDWFLRAGLIGPFLHVDKVLAQWRHHDGSISVSQHGIERFRVMYRMIESFFSRDDLPTEVRAVELETWRNTLVTGALTMGNPDRAIEERFIILDTLGELDASDEDVVKVTFKSEQQQGRGGNDLIARLQKNLIHNVRSLAKQEEGIAWLRGIVAEHEATIAAQAEGIAWLRHALAERETTITAQAEGIAWLRHVHGLNDQT